MQLFEGGLSPGPSECGELRSRASHLQKASKSIHALVADVSKLGGFMKQVSTRSGALAKLADEGEGSGGMLEATVVLQGVVADLEAQLHEQFLAPLAAYAAKIDAALQLARHFDDQSQALDAAELKYLSLSRDASVETRAHGDHDLSDKAAALALDFFDCRAALGEAYSSLAFVPQRAYSSLLQAVQGACGRALTPKLERVVAEGDAASASLQERVAANAKFRASLPQPQLRSGTTLCEGWLHKGSFNLSTEVATVKEQLNRFKPWNRRWFVLCSDGRLYYYRSQEDVRTPKVPIDMNLLSSVTPMGESLEFHIQVMKA